MDKFAQKVGRDEASKGIRAEIARLWPTVLRATSN
jgi:hypothetical protein